MAQRYPTHNEGADVFRFELIETLAEAVFDPSFHNREDARDHFRESDSVREFLFRHWPPLTPEQALNDLFGSKNLLRLAARGTSLSEAELVALRRQRTPHRDVGGIRWSYADIPLLDELLAQVGVLEVGERDDERIMERDETTEFELADQRDADDDLRFDDEADDDLQLDDEANGQDVSLDAIAAAAPGDPMFDTAVLQERFESEA